MREAIRRIGARTRRGGRGATVATPALRAAGVPVAVLGSAPVVILLVDAEGTVIYRNGMADLAGRKATAAYGDAVMPRLRERLTEIIRTRQPLPFTVEIAVTSPATAARGPLDVTVELTADHVVGVPGLSVATWRDLTPIRTAEQTVLSLSEELVSAAARLTEHGQGLHQLAATASGDADSAASGARELTESIREIAANAAAATSGAQQAVESAHTAAESLDRLQQASDQIGGLTQLIEEIADQTRLLALNATIESARAGEAGRGFAVVAQEVRELAGRTEQATQQITEMVTSIQAEMERAGQAVAGIESVVDQVAQRQVTIAGAVEEQTATAGVMSAAISGTADITSRTAQSAREVLDGALGVDERATRLRQAFQVR